MKTIALITLLVAAVSANSYSSSYSQPQIRTDSYAAPAVRVVDVPTVKVEMSSGPSDYQTQAPAPVSRNSYEASAMRSSYAAPEIRVQSYDAPAPAVRSSYDAPEIRVQSYDAPAMRTYEAPARVVDVPTVQVEFKSESPAYEAPALKTQSYEAPAVRTESYDAPAIRVQSYDAPAPALRSYEAPKSYQAPARVEVPTHKVEFKSEDSSYQAPAQYSSYSAPEIRVQSYDSPAPAVRSSYDAPEIRVQSYDAPAPAVRSSYDASEIRVQSYDAPALRTYEAPARAVDVPTVQVEFKSESPAYEAPAVRAQSYEAPAVRTQSYEAPAVRTQSYEAPAVRTESYDAPAIRVQSYDAPALRSSYEAPKSYQAPARVEVPTAKVEFKVESYEAPAQRTSYAPQRMSYAEPAQVVRSSGY